MKSKQEINSDVQSKLCKKIKLKYGEWASVADAMTTKEIDETILKYAKMQEEILMQKQCDTKLNEILELKKEIEASYREALISLKDKIRYLVFLLESKGGDSSGAK